MVKVSKPIKYFTQKYPKTAAVFDSSFFTDIRNYIIVGSWITTIYCMGELYANFQEEPKNPSPLEQEIERREEYQPKPKEEKRIKVYPDILGRYLV